VQLRSSATEVGGRQPHAPVFTGAGLMNPLRSSATEVGGRQGA
jgi:hypothetical protein